MMIDSMKQMDAPDVAQEDTMDEDRLPYIIPDPVMNARAWEVADNEVRKMLAKIDKLKESRRKWRQAWRKEHARAEELYRDNAMYRELAVREQTEREAAEARAARLVEAGDGMYDAIGTTVDQRLAWQQAKNQP